MQPKILRIKTSESRYGGNIYETYMAEYLSQYYKFDEINSVPKIQAKWKYFAVFGFFYNLYKIAKKKEYTVHIRALETAFFFNPKVKNIVIAHHYDTSYSNVFTKMMQTIAYWNLQRNRDKIDRLVVVSRYWKKFFEERGFQNIILIYNPFEVEYFEVKQYEIDAFKAKYGLTDKPIVYIGNAQKKKGVHLVYEALCGLDVYLVTSGKNYIDIPVTNLDLPFREYIVMLHASSVVVAMSLFKEGWNRTVHEAMLCKTIVVGSGKGGMRELLMEGGQIVCEEYEQIKEKVTHSLYMQEFSSQGYDYAKQFTRKRFEEAIKSMLDGL